MNSFVLPPNEQIHPLTRGCSPRPWSLFIVFCVFLIAAGGALPFILGRVINISTRLEHQLDDYNEATIWGDLSESDIAAAQTQLTAFTVSLLFLLQPIKGTLTDGTQDYVRTWTLSTFTDRSSLPTAVKLKYNEDNVYFAELTESQLKPNGKGMGTFVQNGTISDMDDVTVPPVQSMSEGSLLRYVNRRRCETGNSHFSLHMIGHLVGELGCTARNFRSPRNICKWNGWSEVNAANLPPVSLARMTFSHT